MTGKPHMSLPAQASNPFVGMRLLRHFVPRNDSNDSVDGITPPLALLMPYECIKSPGIT